MEHNAREGGNQKVKAALPRRSPALVVNYSNVLLFYVPLLSMYAASHSVVEDQNFACLKTCDFNKLGKVLTLGPLVSKTYLWRRERSTGRAMAARCVNAT